MARRHGHTWSLGALAALALLCLSADAQARGSQEPQITGPGGEATGHGHGNQVQVWSCLGGKMANCSVHEVGGGGRGGEMTPSGRRGRDGKVPKLKITYNNKPYVLPAKNHNKRRR